MLPTKGEHLELLKELLPLLHKDIQSWVQSGNQLIGDMFVRPVKTENGFTTQGGPVDTVINWSASLDQIYGRSLEKFTLREKLLNHLFPFYRSTRSCPPRMSIGDNNTHELKDFLVDILDSSSTAKATYSLPAPQDLAEKTYEFFTRLEDVFYLDIPLLGLETKQAVAFKWGELIPIDLETRINYLRDRSVGYGSVFTNPMQQWRILDAEVLLKISLKWPRGDKSGALIYPTQIQVLARNTVNLLRMYGFGGVLDCFQSAYIEGVGHRGRGVMSSGVDSTRKEKYQINDPGSLTKFLDNYVSDKFDDNHDLSFIINRVAEAWTRARSQEFQIFDYVSVLEALLVPNSEPETAFKVSLFAAHLTGTSKKSRNEVFELVRKAYRVRNAIAHCKSELKPKDKFEPAELKKFGDVVHAIIRKAFSDGGVEALRTEARNLIV